MKSRTMLATMLVAGAGTLVAPAMAGSTGFISTDRFGYAGTVVRYTTLADAQGGTNSIDTVNVSERDMSLFVVSDSASTGFTANDYNIITSSWWYTTVGPGAGAGNTNGNTGVGFMQLYDDNGNTDSSVDMSFSGYDGTNYTEFALSMMGGNATTADDFARMSVYDNVNDAGIWVNYQLDLTATGLEGVDDGFGFVTANNQPTGVTGTFTGIFELTENQTSAANQGFYVVNFALNMDNWAWDNRNDLVGPYDQFFDSTFGANINVVPLPPAALAGLGMLGGIAGVRRLHRR
jgi:hypothetical protein